MADAFVRGCFVKKVLLKISQNSQENTDSYGTWIDTTHYKYTEAIFGIMSNIYSGIFLQQIVNAYIWDKVFKSEPSKICGGQSLKILKWYGLLYATLWVTLFCRKLNELSQNLSFGSEFVLVFEIWSFKIVFLMSVFRSISGVNGLYKGVNNEQPSLIHFMPVFVFYTSQNVRKLEVFWYFQGL